MIDATWRRQIGPCALEAWGARWIAVRCPCEHADLMRVADGLWEPGRGVWLMERRRIGPVIRILERDTDPLFRHAGLPLDVAAREVQTASYSDGGCPSRRSAIPLAARRCQELEVRHG